MSVDPASAGASAAAGAAAEAALDALLVAELNALAADAQALQAQVQIGDIVTAQVLPPNGLTDLLSILGNRVAAALPPNLVPGDVITAQVTGFKGQQVQLQILDPPRTASGSAPLPDSPAAGAPVAPVPPQGALAAAASNPLGLAASQLQALAPPVAVFVAASVKTLPANLPSQDTPPAGADSATATPPATPAPPAASGPPPLTPAAAGLATTGPLGAIEARMAAARAGAVTVNVPPPAPPPTRGIVPAPPPSPPAAPTAQAAAPPPAPPQAVGFVPPPIVNAAPRFAGGTPAPPAPESASSSDASGLQQFRDPVTLVRALRLPVTPTNVAAARLALETPQRLPAALATLERALPATDDPRVATLRTLAAFVGRLDPKSPQLPTQIAAYVDHVVSGSEPKLVELLVAQQAASSNSATESESAPAMPAEPTLAEPLATPPAAPLPVVALAQIVERTAALGASLKTQLVALVNGPPAGAGEDVTPAAASALAAVTSVQLSAAQNQVAIPQTMQFVLPMWLGSGYAQAQIAVDRDAPEQRGAPLDGDNFHIAFVLDTQHIGTVAIDLVSVGRAFSLAVKTENSATAERFAGAMSRLTERLSSLRYTVNSAEAHVAPPTAPVTPPPAAIADNPLGAMNATA